ncbi:hypothetical protein O9929_26865 [Vibrio lentus]|nr:hypothetical protein [Vibrio lentus]
MNSLVYNIHLLTGKISTPGNSPFSLTGQPSACVVQLVKLVRSLTVFRQICGCC